MTLEEAIRKITSLPASQMGLKNRGIIEKGKFADITIFGTEVSGNGFIICNDGF